MADGQFFKVDSQFLEAHVVAKSYELLKAEGFEGASDEFNQARNELAADNVKGAIHNACKSLESVLKAVSAVVEVPRVFGELAVHLTASLLLIVVHRSIQLKRPTAEEPIVQSASVPEDDIPF